MKTTQKDIRLILITGFLMAAQMACSLLAPVQEALAVEQESTVGQTEVVNPPSVTAVVPTAVIPTVVSAPATSAPGEAQKPYGLQARAFLEEIVGDIGPRLTGSDADKTAANYIQDALEKMGYEVQRQPFVVVGDEGETLASANIIAVKKGLSEQEIVVGAHYDSADDGVGADDNASGVSVLLETAQRIKDVETPYTVRFIAFGAEETGLNGSSYFLSHLDQGSIQKIVYMVNMDSLIAGEIAYVYGDTAEKGNLRDWMLAKAKKEGYALEGKTADDLDPPDEPCECSDYYPFKMTGIPYIFFEATNWNLGEQDGWTQVNEDLGDNGMIWHTPYDTIEYIDKIAPDRIDEHLETFVRVLVEALKEYQLP